MKSRRNIKANKVKYGQFKNGRSMDVSSTSSEHVPKDWLTTLKTKWIREWMWKNSATESKNADRGTIFPRNTRWLICILTLIWRVRYVTDNGNWWILHPDEVYQSLEVAHSEVYGFGFRPYEYLPPPSENISQLPESRAVEYKYGMYSLRSFLYPRALATVMAGAKFAGVQMSPFLVGKIFHACIAGLLPLSVFWLSQALFCCPDVATLASIFVAASFHLNLFGTHVLVNSFLSPALYISLIPIVRSLLKNSQHSPKEQNGRVNGSVVVDKDSQFFYATDINFNRPPCHTSSLAQHQGLHSQWETRKSNGNSKNGHLHIMEAPKTIEMENRENLVTGVPLVEIFTMKSKYFAAGVAFALCVYIRVDLILLTGIVVVCFSGCDLRLMFWCLSELVPYIFGMFAGFLIGGFDNYISYGQWFISPIQWLKLNVLGNFSGTIFGTQNKGFYLTHVVFYDTFSTCAHLVCVIELFVSFAFVQNRIQLLQQEQRRNESARALCLSTVLLYLIYSFQAHKESRFVHNVIVLAMMSFSSGIIHLLYAIPKLFSHIKYSHLKLVIIFLATFACSSQFFAFTSLKDRNFMPWTFGKHDDTQDVNNCLNFVRNQKDVTGLFLDSNIYGSGAYSILNKDVPLLVFNVKEFFEFDSDSRLNLTSRGLISKGFTQSLTVFSKLTDFISIQNIPYLLKVLMKKRVYNYIILKTDREFIDIGYKEVFRHGRVKVMVRTFYPADEKKLSIMADKIPLGANATVLEYEASRLRLYGIRTSLVEQKLLLALQLDDQRVRAYKYLAQIYTEQNRPKDISEITKLCIQKVGKEKCMAKWQRPSLDTDTEVRYF